MTDYDKREAQASQEPKWSDRDMLAFLRAATAPDRVKDRIYLMMREASKK